MKIDLHSHTSMGSGCSAMDIRGLIRDARAAGMDAICVTDHDVMVLGDEERRIADEEGFPVFLGIEISAAEGHILCFGCDGDRSLFADAAGAPLEVFAPRLLEAGAALVAAHPIRPGWPRTIADDLDRYLPHLTALEGYNGNCTADGVREILRRAEEADVPVTGGSDAHHPGRAGWAWTEFERWIADERELARELRTGRFTPGCSDPALAALLSRRILER